MGLSIVILAAGIGKRMRSQKPKVLHRLAGRSLLEHVITAAFSLHPQQLIVVYGHGGELVKKTLNHLAVDWVQQATQQGTGDALKCALPLIKKGNQVLVLYGDVPLISQTTLRSLYAAVSAQEIGIITALLENPFGYGRILRNKQGELTDIVEEKEGTDKELLIKEVNTGIYLFPYALLENCLPRLTNKNSQQEYYLTDLIKMARKEKTTIRSITASHYNEVMGVNDRKQLATLERAYQTMMTNSLLEKGVTLLDPARVDLRGEVEVGEDVTIDINVIFKGDVRIGSHCHIGAQVILKNVTLGNHVHIDDFCHLEDVIVHDHCIIGPFARIRPGTVIHESAKVGNFVEIKKSIIGKQSKVNHLSYIGDTTMGDSCNIGAGTITCNYDGVNKHETHIGNRVFVGSDCQLIAPVSLGDDAVIGAGSTITKNAPAGELTLSRAPQVSYTGWRRKTKNNKEKKQ